MYGLIHDSLAAAVQFLDNAVTRNHIRRGPRGDLFMRLVVRQYGFGYLGAASDGQLAVAGRGIGTRVNIFGQQVRNSIVVFALAIFGRRTELVIRMLICFAMIGYGGRIDDSVLVILFDQFEFSS